MIDKWARAEGTGWISLGDFGRINPRRDYVGGAGRTFFTAMTGGGEYAQATGDCIEEGPETWRYEPDQPFYLADSTKKSCIEVEISILQGGKYGIRYRLSQWPQQTGGAW